MPDQYRVYYAQQVMKRIGDLQFGIIGIGIALLALNYLGLVTMTDLKVLSLQVFWQRIALLTLVIVFAAYCAIIYNAYMLRAVEAGIEARSVQRPFRLFALFLLDIAQLTVMASMYGILYIPDTWSLVSGPCKSSLSGCLALDSGETTMIFFLGGLWHAFVATWYLVADGRSRNVLNHAAFTLVYWASVLLSLFTAWFSGWVTVGGLLLLIAALFVFQGQRWLRSEID